MGRRRKKAREVGERKRFVDLLRREDGRGCNCRYNGGAIERPSFSARTNRKEPSNRDFRFESRACVAARVV